MSELFSGDPLSELPLGLAMNLARSPGAMERFSNLPEGQKTGIVAKIQSAKSGDEARKLIDQAMQSLT
jgi:uncharacterized protein YdeI (YjbR/CyaY-like superfamily)